MFALWIPHHQVMCIFYKEKIHSDLYFWLNFFLIVLSSGLVLLLLQSSLCKARLNPNGWVGF